MFSINIEQFKSALVSMTLMAILGVAGYIIGLGDVFKIEWHALINVAVMAFLTGLVSLSKSFLTTDSGRFAGVTQVVNQDPPITE